MFMNTPFSLEIEIPIIKTCLQIKIDVCISPLIPNQINGSVVMVAVHRLMATTRVTLLVFTSS